MANWTREQSDRICAIRDEILKMGSDNFNRFGGEFEGGIHLQKDPMEYAQLIVFLQSKENPPKSFLEIGSAAGGGCFALHHYLNFNRIVIMDDNNHVKSPMREQVLAEVDRKEYIGDAHSEDALNYIKGGNKFDLILIDADQTYDGTLSFIDTYMEFLEEGGILVLHNITESSCSGVGQVDMLVSKGYKDYKVIEKFTTCRGRLGLGLYSK